MTKQKIRFESSVKTKVNRRQFMKTAATVGAAVMAPTIIPCSALGRGGAVAPSERIVLGGLGVGGRGRYDLERLLNVGGVQFVADCDINKERANIVKDMVDKAQGNTDCVIYRDLRVFLAERTDIDALLIATGDRWHALASIMAMRAGKDVYSEKPSAMTIQEGQAVMDTAARYGRVYQTGTQRLSEANFTFANEILRLGRLGEVHTVHAHIAPWDSGIMRKDWLPEEALPNPEDIDWDIWLGPCPWRPYNYEYVKGGWRGHHDFHTSCIGEWGAHTFAQCQVALGLQDTSPVRYNAVSNDTGDGMVTEFANGKKMVFQRDTERKYWHGSCGVRYEGPDGWVSIADGYEKPEVSSPALMDGFTKIVNDYIARTQHPMDHWEDFLNCVRTRRSTISNPSMMHHSMTTVHAANISLWLGRPLTFDPVKQIFPDDAEANRFLSRAQREPWVI